LRSIFKEKIIQYKIQAGIKSAKQVNEKKVTKTDDAEGVIQKDYPLNLEKIKILKFEGDYRVAGI
jgi:hypothetical protein